MSKELLAEVKTWSSLKADHKPPFLEYLRSVNPWVFSHHPHNACFREHVWAFNGFYLCKGCVVTTLGFLAGGIMQLATDWLSHFPEETVGIFFAAMLLPSILATILNAPRPVRHVSRFLLGALIASAVFLVVITDRWDVRLIVAGTYLVTRFMLGRLRDRRNSEALQNAA